MGAKKIKIIPHQGLKPASTGKETADQVVWLEGPERGRRMPNIKVDLKEENKLASSKLRLSETMTHSLAGVKCRATSVAKKILSTLFSIS